METIYVEKQPKKNERKASRVSCMSDGAAADYDPHDYGNTLNPTSYWGTVFHLVIVSAGPEVLSIPVMFATVGNVVGFFLTFATVAFYAYNVNMIVWSEYRLCKGKRVPNCTYSDMVYHVLENGPPCVQRFASCGKHLINVVFVAIWFGHTCYNFILISRNLQTACGNLYHVNLNFHDILELVFVPLLLLTWIPKLSHLVPFSVSANILNVISILFVVYYVFVDPSPWRNEYDDDAGSAANLPLFLGTILFTVNATGIALPLKNEMEYSNKFASTFGVVNVSYVLTSLLYAFFSLVCGLKYGKSLQDSVIQNLPHDQILAQVIIVLSTLALVFQYPLLMYVAFDTIWNNALKEKRKTMAFPVVYEYAVRSVLVMLSFLMAYAVPNVSLFLSFSGTVGTSIDSIIFPAVIETLMLWKTSKSRNRFRWMFLKNAFIVIFGLILAVVGVHDCLKGLL